MVYYLYVSFSRLNTSVGKERAGFSAFVYSYFLFSSNEFVPPLDAWERL